MNTILDDLFNDYSQIFSPGTPKSIASRLLKDEYKVMNKHNLIEWSDGEYSLEFWCNEDRYTVSLGNGETVLFDTEGSAGDYVDNYDEGRIYKTGKSYLPIEEWDSFEKELFVKQIFGL